MPARLLTNSVDVVVGSHAGVEALPAGYEALFARLAQAGEGCAGEWLRAYRDLRVGPGSEFRLFSAAHADGAPLALLPAVYSRLYLAHPRARVIHFLQPDGEPYTPLGLPEDPALAGLLARSVVAHLRAASPRYDVLRVSPLDPGAPFAVEFEHALRHPIHPLRVEHLAPDRWHPTAGVRHAAYMASRPVALLQLLADARRALIDSRRATFRLLSMPGEIADGWRDYCAILGADRHLLEAESPDYARGLMDVSSRAGRLRLGFVDVDGTPAAVQLWRLGATAARCLRIWSGPEFRGLPVDDLLTEYMTRQLLDADRAAGLDFGAITEEFAAQWAPRAHPRIGLIAFNPRTSRGVRGAIRHLGAAALRSLWERISSRRGAPGS